MFETLENRRMLSAVTFVGNTLNIVGTSEPNNILVEQMSPVKFLIFSDGNPAVYTSANPIFKITIDGKGGADNLAIGPSVGTFGISSATLLGGKGDDLLANLSVKAATKMDGGEGIDTVDYSCAPEEVTVTLDGVANDGVDDNPHDNVLSSVENVLGSQFDDLIVGNSSANDLQGGEGDDTILGLAGADTLDGNDGNDSLKGGDGNDVLIGGDDRDTLLGEAGDDTLYANNDNEYDILSGGAGKDTAFINDGDNFSSDIENLVWA